MTGKLDGLAERLVALAPLLDELLQRIPPLAQEELEFDDGFRRPHEFGTEYVHYFTNYRIIMSREDLADIGRKLEVVRGQGDATPDVDAFDYLVAMLESRLTRLVRGFNYNLVSLGGDCLSRSVPTKWGLKPPRLLGEPTMPFDLSVHPPASVAEILERDFLDYLDVERLRYDGERNVCVDPSRQIIWNHEVGSDWAASEFAALRDLYARRIENFHNALTDGRPTVALLYVSARFNEAALRIAYRITRALNRLASNRLAVVCIGSSEKSSFQSSERPVHIEWLGRTALMLFRVPLPHSWYAWPLHNHFTRPEGMEFEQRINNCVAHAVQELQR
jgi:hypothetical protein